MQGIQLFGGRAADDAAILEHARRQCPREAMFAERPARIAAGIAALGAGALVRFRKAFGTAPTGR